MLGVPVHSHQKSIWEEKRHTETAQTSRDISKECAPSGFPSTQRHRAAGHFTVSHKQTILAGRS
jgi:hypothetical protein